ncbi:MAG: helix-turn-helix domain-containing protein [Actinobacteria bacterium]|nr:helix-turn-helix domain-containing protein [Actinomycetota bacterium]
MGSWAGNLIKLARLEQGLSQREVARRAHTSQATISAYEAGEKSPSLDTLTRIVRALGLDLRIQLAPADSHDEWLALYERSLPGSVVERSRRIDRELVQQARSEKVVTDRAPG